MTSLFPPFNRRNTLRKLPYFYEAGRGAFYKATASAMTLNLDFTTGSLDPRITFSRGTNATLTDSTGKITYAPANLFLQSQSLATSPWVASSTGVGSTAILANNYAAAPDGTTTASRVQLNLNSGTATSDISSVYQSVNFTSGASLFSFYAKSNDSNSYVCQLINPDGTATNITITSTWQRFYSTVKIASASINYAIRLRGGQTPANSNTADVLVWGAQVEPVTYQTTPSPYVSTTASAYYGPRFDYDPNTLACKGLLIEEQRTNLLTYSNTFNNAVWTSSTMTPTASAVISPDGTANAWTLTGTSTGSYLFQSQPTTTGTFTASVYLRAGTVTSSTIQFSSAGNGYNCAYNLSTGQAGTPAIVGTGGTLSAVSATMTSIGNSWYRCTFTFTTSGTANNFFIYGGNGTITAYGAQLEAGAFATSYIPTTTATATRNADVASMTGSNFSSWYNQSAGTFAVNYLLQRPLSTSTVWRAINAWSSGNNNLSIDAVGYDGNPRLFVQTSGATQVAQTINPEFTSSLNKIVFAYAENDFAGVVNNGTVGTDTSGTVPVVTTLNIGSQAAGTAQINGCIASIRYYNKRLPNATLQSLTS